jgi:hypothetical protein
VHVPLSGQPLSAQHRLPGTERCEQVVDVPPTPMLHSHPPEAIWQMTELEAFERLVPPEVELPLAAPDDELPPLVEPVPPLPHASKRKVMEATARIPSRAFAMRRT